MKSEGSFKLLEQNFDHSHFVIRYDFPGSFLEFVSRISIDTNVKGIDPILNHFLSTGELLKIVRTVTTSHIEYRFECKDSDCSGRLMTALSQLKIGKDLA